MNMSSSWTEDALRVNHNISVMRHPDPIGNRGTVNWAPFNWAPFNWLFTHPPTSPVQHWSHHENVVVVDNHVAAVGGINLCYGRWDTHNHPLADVHPTDLERTLFVAQDYSNPRVMDSKDAEEYLGGTVSILETPRMPWHDVSPIPIALRIRC